jgi:hypothetical protein
VVDYKVFPSQFADELDEDFDINLVEIHTYALVRPTPGISPFFRLAMDHTRKGKNHCNNQ